MKLVNGDTVQAVELETRGIPQPQQLVSESLHPKGLREKLAEVAQSLPPDVKIERVYDRTELVDHVMDTVRKNLFEGGLFVVAVLFLFLGNFRSATIVAVLIPLSLLATFIGLTIRGIPASLLALGAMDFGIIVDGGNVGKRTHTLLLSSAANAADPGAAGASGADVNWVARIRGP